MTGIERPPHPWERIESDELKESLKAYEAFSVYRDMGAGRSLLKVSQELSKSEQLMKRWSARFSWVERAAQYDDHMDRLGQQAEEEAYQESKKQAKIERLAIIASLKGTLTRGLTEMEEALLEGDEDKRLQLDLSDLLKLSALVLDQERIEYDDLPTRKSTVRGSMVTYDPSKLTDDQLQRIVNGEPPEEVISS